MTTTWHTLDPTDTPRLLAEAERLASNVAGFGIQVSDSADLPAAMAVLHGGRLGFTSGWLGESLYGTPCPAVVLCLGGIREAFPGDFPMGLLAVLIHETAHVVEYVADFPAMFQRPAPFQGADLQEAVAELNASPPPADLATDARFRRMHDSRFLRAAIHVHDRIGNLAGAWPPLEWTLPSTEWGLSRPYLYARALGDEPQGLAFVPLSAVLRLSPPAEFSALWADDVDRLTQGV